MKKYRKDYLNAVNNVWKWLIKNVYAGGIRNVLAQTAMFVILMTEMGALFALGFFLSMRIEDYVNDMLISGIALIFFSVIAIFAPVFRLARAANEVNGKKTSFWNPFVEKKPDQHLGDLPSSELKIKLTSDELPYFRDMLEKSQIEYVTQEAVFHNYKFKDGKESTIVQVSDDGKWVRISKYYFPIDLICGYSKYNNELYTIDGATLYMSQEERKPGNSSQIEKFFEERGKYFKTLPMLARLEFQKIVEKDHPKLHKADWSSIRYKWEKAIANNIYLHPWDKTKGHRFKPISKSGSVNRVIFERVLSVTEIQKISVAIEKNPEVLKDFLNFSDYKNEYCVCNAIEMLPRLGETRRTQSLDFLFECLKDADEAYFLPAVNVLKSMPRDVLDEKIETNAQTAYESGDALRLAGVIYLAKEIDYEVAFIKALKEAAREEDALSEAEQEIIPSRTVLKDGLKVFCVDE